VILRGGRCREDHTNTSLILISVLKGFIGGIYWNLFWACVWAGKGHHPGHDLPHKTVETNVNLLIILN